MQLPFLGVIFANKNHWNSSMYDSQPGVDNWIYGSETKSQKLTRKHCKIYDISCVQYVILKGGRGPVTYYQKRESFILNMP